MRCFIACCLLFAALAAAGRTEADDTALFADFKLTYNRKYAEGEEAHRFRCFRSNLDLIEARNAKATHERHGVNQFTDLCKEEFAKYYLGARPPANRTQKHIPDLYQPHELVGTSKINWADLGAVTPIKNQGQCGSCWSFSTTGGIEGQWYLAGHPLVGLSEEELVQCSKQNYGCQGGWVDEALEWVISNNGINAEKAYPYTSGGGSTGTCRTVLTKDSVAQIIGHQDLPHSEAQMATWVLANGPLSIALDAESWQTYNGGIMTDCTQGQLDHAVLIVGFDTTHSPPYWVVKNSWGTSWGENGYIRLQYGTNQCSLNQAPSTSKVDKSTKSA
jgi:cysteine peptidase B